MDSRPSPSKHHSRDCCEVCHAEVCFSDILKNRSLGYVVCSDVECKKLLEQKSQMPSALYKPYFAFQKARIVERKQRDADKIRQKNTVILREDNENSELFARYLDQNPGQDPQKLDVLMIPSGLSREVALASSRIEKYKEHIRNIIADAVEAKDISGVVFDQHAMAREHLLALESELSDKPRVREVSDRICTLCRGGCCSIGGEHGFLSAATIRRMLDEDKRITPDNIAERYFALIPDKSIAGSCINQTTSGCALPRALRSDVCNSYYCEELRQFQKINAEDVTDVTLLLIQRDNTNWNRFSFETENRVLRTVLMGEKSEVEIHLSQ